MDLIQISDIHLSHDGSSVREIDVHGQFQSILTKAQDYPCDLLIISGDICSESGDIRTYKSLKALLEQKNLTYLIMSGNHDNSEVLASVFPDGPALQGGELFGRKEDLLFLDTSSNSLSQQQLDWLYKEDSKRPYLLFMHHPPKLMNMKFMDLKYPLENIKEVSQAFSKLKNCQGIFTGHYHCALKDSLHGIPLYVCPSTMMQLSPHKIEYEIVSTRAAFRIIKWKNGVINSRVINI
jgi:3',5'-cyclic-AMP phosphodiesterase